MATSHTTNNKLPFIPNNEHTHTYLTLHYSFAHSWEIFEPMVGTMVSHNGLVFLISASLVLNVEAFVSSYSLASRHSIIRSDCSFVSKLDATPQVGNVDNAISTQINEDKNGRLLTTEQVEFFDSLDTGVYGGAFIERLRDLQEFKNKHGTCHVPKRNADNPKLGRSCMHVIVCGNIILSASHEPFP